MATYNFTVRATDNTGSFTDKNFAITVNNTQVDRFVAVGNNSIARSKDGVNWFYDLLPYSNNLSGVTWGNNQWVVYSWTEKTIYTSPDAMNWTRVATTLDTIGTGNSNPTFTCIRYRGDRWVGFVNVLNGSSVYSKEYWSTDLKSWTYKNDVYSAYVGGNGTTAAGIWEYEYDPLSQTGVASGYFAGGYLLNRVYTDNRGWNSVNATFGAATVMNSNSYVGPYMQRVFFQNGLWIATNGQSGLYTSYNTRDWFYRDTSAVGNNQSAQTAVTGVVYSNGRLLTIGAASNNTAPNTFQSVDAGRTWTLRSNFGAMGSNNYSFNYRQHFATYAGTTVVFNSANNYLYTTTNDFADTVYAASQQANSLVGFSSFGAVAARNT